MECVQFIFFFFINFYKLFLSSLVFYPWQILFIVSGSIINLESKFLFICLTLLFFFWNYNWLICIWKRYLSIFLIRYFRVANLAFMTIHHLNDELPVPSQSRITIVCLYGGKIFKLLFRNGFNSRVWLLCQKFMT